MLQYLDKYDQLATLRMLRAADARLFLVVEGVSDARSLERHISLDHCTLIYGYGKQSVLDAMAEIEEIDPNGCVGLVDRDFGDWVDGAAPTNVFTTELYDRESDLLLGGNLLVDYIEAIRDETMRDNLLEASASSSVFAIIIEIAATIGRVRWASVRDNLELNLSKFPVGRTIKWPAVVTEASVIDLAICRGTGCELEVDDIHRACSKAVAVSDERLCSGHDLVSAVAASSRWWAKPAVGRREIRNYIVAAVRCDILRLVPWFHSLESWANERNRRIWSCAA